MPFWASACGLQNGNPKQSTVTSAHLQYAPQLVAQMKAYKRGFPSAHLYHCSIPIIVRDDALATKHQARSIQTHTCLPAMCRQPVRNPLNATHCQLAAVGAGTLGALPRPPRPSGHPVRHSVCPQVRAALASRPDGVEHQLLPWWVGSWQAQRDTSVCKHESSATHLACQWHLVLPLQVACASNFTPASL